MKKRLGYLIAGSLAFWAALYFPIRSQWGEPAVVYSLIALGLCLVPASLTLAWASHRAVRSAGDQVFLVFGGTGLRMAVVLGGALMLSLASTHFQQPRFWVLVLVFYLATLVLEVLLLRGEDGSEPV